MCILHNVPIERTPGGYYIHTYIRYNNKCTLLLCPHRAYPTFYVSIEHAQLTELWQMLHNDLQASVEAGGTRTVTITFTPPKELICCIQANTTVRYHAAMSTVAMMFRVQ